MQDVTVIGIDPGSRNTGWGVVREHSGKLELLECGVIRTGRQGEVLFSDRLACIYRELSDVLARLRPQEAAVEQIFTAVNAATALKLGQARGVAVAACAGAGLPICDYEPTLVKKTITGSGRAEKEQVQYMVARLLGVRDPHWALDTSDALGIALCHLTMRRVARLETAAGGRKRR